MTHSAIQSRKYNTIIIKLAINNGLVLLIAMSKMMYMRYANAVTCDRDFLSEQIWADWSDWSWSDRICLIFSFSIATVLKADFRSE